MTPDAVASFSMGEPSGAVACGALSPTQGALVMSAMTDCVARAEGDGGMLAVIGLRSTRLRPAHSPSDTQAASLLGQSLSKQTTF